MVRRETYLTAEGLTKLGAELEHLRTVRRQEVAHRIQRAKEVGGTVDNAAYDEAKNEQAFVEGRILTLETMIQNAVIIPGHEAPTETVEIGSVVTVAAGDGKAQKFTIVGSTEADPTQGKISNESPVGKALLGRKVGAQVEVTTPARVFRLKVVNIE